MQRPNSRLMPVPVAGRRAPWGIAYRWRWMRAAVALVVVACSVVVPREDAHSTPPPQARIERIDNVRILHLYGNPYQMGRQQGALLRGEIRTLYKDYFVRFAGGDVPIAIAAKVAEVTMLPHIPEDYKAEMRGLAEGAGLSFEEVLTAQAFLDIKKLVQCSTVSVTGSASGAGEPMLGRNLDFPSLGIAHRHSLVVVRHPTEGQTTVSVGWPLLIGVFSGMNQAGVSLAMMEVYTAESSIAGMPYAFQYRRALEQSNSTSEVIQFIRAAKHTASNNLMVLDAYGDSAVLEITAKQVALRSAVKGRLFATNHHRSPPLAQKTGCRRYQTLEKRLRPSSGRLGLSDMQQLLDQVAMKDLNLQAMVFFPRSRRIDLAVGQLPASKGPYVTLPRSALFGSKR